MEQRFGTIHAPRKPVEIPNHSQWIFGQGAGAWFSLDKTECLFNIKRFSLNGKLDCDRFFEIEENGSIFDIEKPYQFIHLSHCAKCRIEQNKIVFIFNYKGE